MTEIAVPEFQDVERALESDRHQVAALRDSRAWISLETHLFERRNKLKARLTKEMFKRNAEPVDQREVDYCRGVIDTIDWMLALPERMRPEGG